MDPFTYMQIASRIEHYETMARHAVRENKYDTRASEAKPPKRLTPTGQRFILFPVRKNANT
jgi:hypothetical protein